MTQIMNFLNDFIFNQIPSWASVLFADVNIGGYSISPVFLVSFAGISLVLLWKLIKLINPF